MIIIRQLMHIHYCLMSYSEHAGPDSEAFWLRPVMAITASVQPESGRIVCMPSPSSRIRFGSVFPKEGPDRIVQNRPGSDLDGLVRLWPNASGPEASRCARIIGPGSGRMQPDRYQFPTFRFGSVLLPTARLVVYKTSLDPS